MPPYILLTSRYSFLYLYWIKMRPDNLTKHVESDHLHADPITVKYYCFPLATERDRCLRDVRVLKSNIGGFDAPTTGAEKRQIINHVFTIGGLDTWFDL